MWLSRTFVGWGEQNLQNRRLNRNITAHFGEKDTLRFLNIMCYDEVDPYTTRGSR